MAQRLFRLLAMIWAASLLTTGYWVAPVLFKSLDRTSAGSVAALLFRGEAIIGLVCGVLLLVLASRLVKQGESAYRVLRRLIVAMLVCVLIGYFALQPFMNEWRMTARSAGIDVGHSVYASRFALLHGVSSIVYLLESLLGLMLIWCLPIVDHRRSEQTTSLSQC